MYAIISEGGGQRRVMQGEEFLADLIDGGAVQIGSAVRFDKVLMVGSAGGSAKVGTPYVTGAAVTAEVVEAVVMGDKLVVQYFQAKKGSRRRTGHRQRYTKLRVTGITG